MCPLAEVVLLVLGRAVPPVLLRPVFGLPLALPDDARGGLVALCFVGPLATAPARAALHEIQLCFAAFDRIGVRIVAISPAPLALARDFVPRHHLLFPLVVQGAAELEAAWGAPPCPGLRGILAGADSAALRRGLRAASQGGGWRGARPCAELLIGRDGRIAHAHRASAVLAGPDLAGLQRAAEALIALSLGPAPRSGPPPPSPRRGRR